MSYSSFKEYWQQCSPRVAVELAIANGVSKAQVQVWTFNLTHKGL